MIEPTFDAWLLHTAGGGALLLLVSCLFMKACRQPAWRQRWGECGLAASLLLGILALGPSWLSVPLLAPEPASENPANFATDSTSQPERALPAERKDAIFFFQPLLDESSGPERKETLGGFLEAYPRDMNTFSAQFPAPTFEFFNPSAPVYRIEPQESSQAADHSPSNTALGSRLNSLGALSNCLRFLYVLMAGLLLARWLVGHVALWRLLRTSRPAPFAVAQLFGTMVHARHNHPRLLISDRLRVPLSCGLWRPTVVLPSSFCRPEAKGALPWVFAHELTHLERRDAWACLVAGLGQAFYFYVPWFWWLRRQLRLCQEYIADAAAVDQVGEPEEYAQFLLTLTKKPALPLGATGVLGYSSDLFRRVTMLLQNHGAVEKRCPRWWSLAAAGSFLALAVLVSGVSLRAQATPAPSEDVQVTVAAALADDDDETPKPKQPTQRPRPPRPPQGPGEGFGGGPPGVDLRQMEEQIQRMQEQLRHMQEQLHLGQVQNQFRFLQQPGVMAGPQGMVGFLSPQGGRLGVQVEPPSATLADQLGLTEGEGLVIVGVQPNSAAAKAGLKSHDVLVEFKGVVVPNDPARLVQILDGIKGKRTVDAVVLRKGKKRTISEINLPAAELQDSKAPFQGQFFSNQPFGGGLGEGGGSFPVQPGGGFGGQGGSGGFGRFPPAGGQPGAGFPGGPGLGGQPGVSGLGGPGLGGPGGLPPGRRHVTTTINRNDDNFSARYREGNLTITASGTISDGTSETKQIEIQDGGQRNTYQSVKEVPEQYREKVKHLVDASSKDNIQIEIKKQREKRKDKKGGGILEETDDDK